MSENTSAINPFDFVRMAGAVSEEDSEIGMVVAGATGGFNSPPEGNSSGDLLVAWIGNGASWEKPENLERLDQLAALIARGMAVMWDQGKDTGTASVKYAHCAAPPAEEK